jgi:hypothetical protein
MYDFDLQARRNPNLSTIHRGMAEIDVARLRHQTAPAGWPSMPRSGGRAPSLMSLFDQVGLQAPLRVSCSYVV